jgi:membrane protease YdiL (CAAX protease family)
MKKASVFALPLFALVFSVVVLNFLPIDRSSAMLIALLIFPTSILASYFLWGKRDIRSGAAGVVLAAVLCSVSLLVLYLIRSGTFFTPTISFAHLAGVLALALSAGILEEFIFRGLLLGLVEIFQQTACRHFARGSGLAVLRLAPG